MSIDTVVLKALKTILLILIFGKDHSKIAKDWASVIGLIENAELELNTPIFEREEILWMESCSGIVASNVGLDEDIYHSILEKI
jgi:hypothetical protein